MRKTDPILCLLFGALAAPGLFAQPGRSLTYVNPGLAPAGSPDLPVALSYSSGSSFVSPSITPLWNGSPRPVKTGNGQLLMVLSASDLV